MDFFLTGPTLHIQCGQFKILANYFVNIIKQLTREAKLYKNQIDIVKKQSLQILPDFKIYYRTIRRHGIMGEKITRSFI